MTKKNEEKLFDEPFVNKWVKALENIKHIENKKRRAKGLGSSKIILSKTLEYQWICVLSVNTRIDMIYSLIKNDIKVRKQLKSFYQLDDHEREGLLLDSIQELVTNYIPFGNKYDATLRQIIHNKGVDMVRAKDTIKNGKDYTFISLNTENEEHKEAFQLGQIDGRLKDIEFKMYLQEIKPTLTPNEINFINLVINEPKMNATEMIKELNISRDTFYRVRTSLQTKFKDLIN